MRAWKRILAAIILGVMAISLCGCGESDEAKLARLTKEAEEKRAIADKARDDYNMLKDFVDKYVN